MGSVVPGAGVNPADQRWHWWPLAALEQVIFRDLRKAVPDLSPDFCTTGLECMQHKKWMLYLATDVWVLCLFERL